MSIRCVCEQEESWGRMIQCSDCLVWQHCECVGLSEKRHLPKHYFCELCQPNDHPFYRLQRLQQLALQDKKLRHEKMDIQSNILQEPTPLSTPMLNKVESTEDVQSSSISEGSNEETPTPPPRTRKRKNEEPTLKEMVSQITKMHRLLRRMDIDFPEKEQLKQRMEAFIDKYSSAL